MISNQNDGCQGWPFAIEAMKETSSTLPMSHGLSNLSERTRSGIMNISRALLLVWILGIGWPAWGQDAQTEIQRHLLERQQRQQEFQLKQQQYMDSVNPRIAPEQKRQMESLHLEQRQRQQELHQRQTQQFEQKQQTVKPESPDQQRLQLEIQNQRFQREQEQQSQRFKRERQKRPQ
jgi:uncharacterized protein HemX